MYKLLVEVIILKFFSSFISIEIKLQLFLKAFDNIFRYYKIGINWKFP